MPRSALLLTALILLVPAAPVQGEAPAQPEPLATPAPLLTASLMPSEQGPSQGAPKLVSKKRQRPLLIALDAGHGGPKLGAVRGKRIEKEITASVVQQLKIRLLSRGFGVVETRPGDEDVDLRERVRVANSSGADLFISIHCNSMPRRRGAASVRGVETFFLSADATDEAARRLAEEENGEPLSRGQLASSNPLDAILFDLQVSAAHHDASRLAGIIQRHLVKATHFPDRGVRQAPFAVLNGAKMPAVLVELGFLSNPAEGKKLMDPVWQGRASTALLGAVDDFSKIVHARAAH